MKGCLFATGRFCDRRGTRRPVVARRSLNRLGALSPTLSLTRTSPRTPTYRPRHSGKHSQEAVDLMTSSGAGVGPEHPTDLLHRCCAGLDVHEEAVVAC